MGKNHLGSIARLSLGPLLFNIYFNDLFMLLEETNISNYVDDTTIYACSPEIQIILNHLERDTLSGEASSDELVMQNLLRMYKHNPACAMHSFSKSMSYQPIYYLLLRHTVEVKLPLPRQISSQ